MSATSRSVGTTAGGVLAFLLITAAGLWMQAARELSLNALSIDPTVLAPHDAIPTTGSRESGGPVDREKPYFSPASTDPRRAEAALSPQGSEGGPVTLRNAPGAPESPSSARSDGDTMQVTDNPPLNLAVINGDLDSVEVLLANGTDVNARSRSGAYPGETPLHSVAYAGHTRIAELLLAYGADLNATDEYRYTPLRRTVEQGHLALTELLINKGADIVTRDTNGLNLLHVVARTDHVEIARLLITGGVDLNAMDRSGFTPLDYAQGGEIRMAETLQDHGAICTIC